MRVAEYPGSLGIHSLDVIEKNIAKVVVDQIVAGLTTSGSGADDSAAANAAWDPRRIVFSGTLDEINAHFFDKDWTDGLPIVPPTPDRIEKFMTYSAYPADKKIGVLPSANLIATPWNVAANAVMAGCRPEHMPVILAAVEALADEKYNLANIGSSSGHFPYVVVNGPIVDELGITCGGQLISRGPNPAIGRAVGLVIRNIAGFRPGKSYMGTFGYPLAFALAEDEKQSPWEPFHVSQGFSKAASTVTMGVTTNWGSPPEVANGPENRSGAEVALEVLVKEVSKRVRVWDLATRGPLSEHAMITVLMSPPVAKSLAEAGYSKKDVAEYLYENARMPLRNYEWATNHTYPGGMSVRAKVKAGLLPEEFAGAPDDMVRFLAGPEIVHIFVCGDSNRNRVMVMEGGHTQPTTKEIKRRDSGGAVSR